MARRKGNCYRCGGKATSKEHVPPQCFFPEGKDIGFDLFRLNLITVPSCYKHNGKKSKDDEFLLAAIAGVVGNNPIGFFHNRTKVKRIFDLNGPNFIHTITRNPKDHIWQSEGINYPVTLGNPHYSRMEECFENIAYGLYYHEFKEVFEGEILKFLMFLRYPNEFMEKKKAVIKKRWEYEPKKKVKGSNPEVFKYQFGEKDEWGFITMKMTFYEGTDIFICYKSKDSELPYHLGFELINSGVKGVIEFPDGENIEFN